MPGGKHALDYGDIDLGGGRRGFDDPYANQESRRLRGFLSGAQTDRVVMNEHSEKLASHGSYAELDEQG